MERQEIPTAGEPQEGTIKLHLFDAFNKSPISEAQITLKDAKKKTKIMKYSDKSGACKIEHAPITFGLLSI